MSREVTALIFLLSLEDAWFYWTLRCDKNRNSGLCWLCVLSMTQVLLVSLMVAWSTSVYTLSQPSCGFTAMTLAQIHPLPGMLLFSTFQLFPRPFKTKLISHCHELWFVSLIFTLHKMSSFSVVVNKFIKKYWTQFHIGTPTSSMCGYLIVSLHSY